jgi:hypothetical protein
MDEVQNKEISNIYHRQRHYFSRVYLSHQGKAFYQCYLASIIL